MAALSAADLAALKAQLCSSTEGASWIAGGGALVGSLAGILLKDFWAAIFVSDRTRKIGQHDVLVSYSAPLALAADRLIWRFGEIFLSDRHHWLMAKTLPLEFNNYKRQSTLYRLASLLGWMRAVDLQRSSFILTGNKQEVFFDEPMKNIRDAFAQGADVELNRLEQLSRVWNLDLSKMSSHEQAKLAADLEVRVFEAAGESIRNNTNELRDLPEEKKAAICHELAAFLAAKLNRSALSSAVVSEKVAETIDNLSYREALIYRDWQDAIGDAMLVEDEDSIRRYKIIGYEKFITDLANEVPWMRAMGQLIVDVNFAHPNPNDFREAQLRRLAAAVSELYFSIAKSEPTLVSTSTAEKCAELHAQLTADAA